MILILTKKPTKEEIKKMGYEYGSYIKLVVDLKKRILAGGGAMHLDGEKVLLRGGSLQKNLWGGGIDLETGEVTYDSMINIRPNEGNTRREIQSEQTRNKFREIVEEFFND